MSPAKKKPINDEEMAQKLVLAYEKIKAQVHQVIVGQDAVLDQLLIAMLARDIACWKVYLDLQRP